MVYNKNIFDLDFTTMTEYQEYVIESVINGQLQQAVKLVKKMSKDQKKEFLTGIKNGDFSTFAKSYVYRTEEIILQTL